MSSNVITIKRVKSEARNPGEASRQFSDQFETISNAQISNVPNRHTAYHLKNPDDTLLSVSFSFSHDGFGESFREDCHCLFDHLFEYLSRRFDFFDQS